MDNNTFDIIIPSEGERTSNFDKTDIVSCIQQETADLLQKLDNIWIQIGYDNDVRNERQTIVLKEVRELFKAITTEAEDVRDALVEESKILFKKVNNMCQELQLKNSVEGYDHLSLLLLKKKLDNDFKYYNDIYTARQAEIAKIILEEKELCQTLGRNIKSLSVKPLPNAGEVNDFKKYLEELSLAISKRKKEFPIIKLSCIEISKELKIKPSLDFEKLVICGTDDQFQVSDENMDNLEQLHLNLETKLYDMRADIAELREKLTILWERLEESPQIRSAFLEKYTGNSVDVQNALKEEVKKYEAKKKANIKIFIDKIRLELQDWWIKCKYSEEDKKKFIYFESDCYTEDLLNLHEIEIEKLRAHHEKNLEIYTLIDKREHLWKRILDLDQRAQCPNRFQNRGGELLREEKERKAVCKKLPQIEAELLQLVDQYEQETDTNFTVFGQFITNMIAEAWDKRKETKQMQLSAKKVARDKAGTGILRTPGKSPLKALKSNALTPLPTPTFKRRIPAPLFGSVPTKKNKSELRKITVPATTVKRASLERRHRLERKSRGSPDYENFKTPLNTKSSCRSTLFSQEKKTGLTVPTASSSKSQLNTPRRPLNRTPSRDGMRSRSPSATTSSRLALPPGNLPFMM